MTLTTTEEWRAYPEDPAYWVSNLGRVRLAGGRVLRQFGKPYRKVFTNGHQRRNVHVMVTRTFRGPRPESEAAVFARHLNGNLEDNRADNLDWRIM